MHRVVMTFCPRPFIRAIAGAFFSALCLARATDVFATRVQPLIEKYCFECHNETKHKGDVVLSGFATEADLARNQNQWLDALAQLQGHLMPPSKSPQPTEQERLTMVTHLTKAMDRIDESAPRSPGRSVIRRLNRAEYQNSIRDLFGVELQVAEEFPADDTAHGFDNVGEALSLSPLLLEKYLAAAEQVIDQVLSARAAPVTNSFGLSAWKNARLTNGAAELKLEQEIMASFQSPAAEEFEALVTATQLGSPDDPATLVLKIDGVDTHVWSLPVEGRKETLRARISIGAGARKIALRHTWHMELPKEKKAPPVRLFVEGLTLRGPVMSVARQRLLEPLGVDEATAGARASLTRFATNAFRRAISTADLGPYLQMYTRSRGSGKTHVEALRGPLVAMLVSPHFVFRIESADGPRDAAGAVRISESELASRLSYFLWSSMPDEELFHLAASGKLHSHDTLTNQVARMLRDIKALSFIQNFAGQWLALRRFETAAPDRDLFPAFKPALRSAMADEPIKFFQRIVAEDRSALEFLHSDWTILNEELARHYGIRNVSGGYMRTVSLDPNSMRGGVLTMGAVLTATSHPTRTSAVKRGKWTLDELLGGSPPPPPPDVPELETPAKGERAATSLRERLERHRDDPKCFGCHARMDALGLALENFDAIGRWRDKDGEFVIDAAAELPGGEKFKGPAEMKRVLLNHKDEFARTLAEKMFVYALGRGPQRSDRREIKQIVGALEQHEYRFSALVNAIVASYPFQHRIPNDSKQP